MSERGQTAWLIEGPMTPSGVSYMAIGPYGSHTGTKDPSIALGFARAVDAESFMRTLQGDRWIRFAEHSFGDPNQATEVLGTIESAGPCRATIAAIIYAGDIASTAAAVLSVDDCVDIANDIIVECEKRDANAAP